MDRDQPRLAYASDVGMDTVLRDSFPASDPPSWAGVALLFPLFIVGLPVALAFRLVLELTGWRIVGPSEE